MTATTREDFMVNGVVSPIENELGIYGFFGKYRCLSNFHQFPVNHGGLRFTCSEGAYMAQKTLDLELRRYISTLSPGEAKKVGRKLVLRPDWDDIRIHAMYRVLLSKFVQDAQSRDVLLSTGDKYLEETNWWKDTFWGVCGGVGQNHLGNTLMTIRDHLRWLLTYPRI